MHTTKKMAAAVKASDQAQNQKHNSPKSNSIGFPARIQAASAGVEVA
ncbi:hypothetical protein OVY01_13550 [Robbsia sp. Bb-Pol-6]|uniref:SMP domain-containing protein n=1 Tax=Robbsia betulipollinis TaxID=2981849 RepID=A0ABT3ZNW9_9BURK|nr:hypothetical protein [Robbsia betulipollinis]MCY0388244.1 hypothetical protein [Robbsia betulipollinis]